MSGVNQKKGLRGSMNAMKRKGGLEEEGRAEKSPTWELLLTVENWVMSASVGHISRFPRSVYVRLAEYFFYRNRTGMKENGNNSGLAYIQALHG